MGKKNIAYIIIGIVTVGAILWVQYSKPKELNWFPSYVTHHKIPFGTKIFTDILQRKSNNAKEVNIPPFQFLNNRDSIGGTYFFANNNISFGEAELNKLLAWTSNGNNLFIASNFFEKQLLDTLHLETDILYGDKGLEHTFQYQFVNQKLKAKGVFPFKKDYKTSYFSKIDTIETTILAVVDNNSDSNTIIKKNVNVVAQSFGKGKIILCAFPKSLTNYFILNNNNKDYTANLLSYINTNKPIYIDTHYKSGKKFYSSPMYIFLNNKELRWAYYIVLIGALLYIIFEGKRKQRAVPVIPSLKNQTLAFTRTIANMYFEKGEQKQILQHRIAYFLDYIRNHFYLSTHKIESDFYSNLASRSNHTEEEIITLFKFIKRLESNQNILDEDIVKLNSSIEKFKAKANGK